MRKPKKYFTIADIKDEYPAIQAQDTHSAELNTFQLQQYLFKADTIWGSIDIQQWLGQDFEYDKNELYLMECAGFYKIGMAQSAKSRMGNIQTGNPLKVTLIAYVNIPDLRAVETYWHTYYMKYRQRGEWFDVTRHLLNNLLIFMDICGGTIDPGYQPLNNHD